MKPIEYPKWIEVDGVGNPDNPGFVLVNNEDEEREAKKSGEGPTALNPYDPNKAVRDMNRDELVNAITARVKSSDASDTDLRFVLTVLTGESGDDDANPKPLTDVAGDKAAPDPADEANKGTDDGTRRAPQAGPKPDTDARPDDAKGKEAKDRPATDQTLAALTPGDKQSPPASAKTGAKK